MSARWIGFALLATLHSVWGQNEAHFEVGFNERPDTFVIQLTDAAKIQKARAIISGENTETPHVSGIIAKAPVFYNPDWSFHLAANSIDFFGLAMEVCDGSASYLEEHLEEVGGALLPGNRWCPWSSKLVRELPRPEAADRAITAAAAASFSQVAISPESLATGFGLRIAENAENGTGPDWPTTIGGVSAKLEDAEGREHTLPLLAVSPEQVNFAVPAETGIGTAKLTVTTYDGRTLEGQVRVERAYPDVFTYGLDGWTVANLVRVQPDGSRQTVSTLQVKDDGTFEPLPIILGAGEELYLELYATGLRRGQVESVGATGGGSIPVLFAGAHPSVIGLDQVNIRIPAEIAGQGKVTLTLRVRDGEKLLESNSAALLFPAQQ